MSREKGLRLIVNNARFLLLPNIRVKNLASRVLSLSARRVREDFLETYNYEPVLFEEDEWKAVYVIAKNAPPPETPPLLGAFTLMIASLGGYLNRKCDGPPVPKTMCVGLQRMVDFALAWKAFGQMQHVTSTQKHFKDEYKGGKI